MDLSIFNGDMSEWNQLQFLYISALKEVNTKLEILNDEFQLIHQYNPIEHIKSRIKTPKSIVKKLKINNRTINFENVINTIDDIAGIRVICSFTSDIFRIAELVANQTDIQLFKIKDYINNPKDNGYKSLHMVVSVPIFLTDCVKHVRVEIQIRTIAMDFWASLEHKIYYKFEGNAPDHIRRDLKECANTISNLDKKMLSINEEVKALLGSE